VVWTATLAGVAAGKAPFGVMEMLFLFAPLVVVPLGLQLGTVVAPVKRDWTLGWARALQPASAIMVVTAFCVPPGWLWSFDLSIAHRLLFGCVGRVVVASKG
jgi:hypothetical protein